MPKAPTTQTIEFPTAITSINEYKNLIHKVNNNNEFYLFRGQRNKNWRLCSSWIRSQTSKEQSENKKPEELTEILRGNILIFEHILPETNTKTNSWLENLALLQHTKDTETPLIDFTDDIMIATWFALAGQINPNEDAALFLFNAVKLDEIKNKIEDFQEKNYVYKSPNVSYRAIAQKSHFLLDNQDWEKNEKITKIIISKKAIKDIVDHLVIKNKTHKSVFPDLKGIFLDNTYNSSATYLLEALKKQNPKHQIPLLDTAIKLNPENEVAYTNRGIAYGLQAKLKKAINDLNKAIEINPDYAMAYYNRGYVYKNQEKYVKAIEDFTQAIKLNPEFAEAYYYRGFTYTIQYINTKPKDVFPPVIKLEKLAPAMKDFDKAIELDPQRSNGLLGSRNCLYRTK